MKRIIIYLTVTLLTFGCEDMLDKEPLGVVSKSAAYQTEADALKALISAYNPLLNFFGDHVSVFDIIADNAKKGGEGPADGAYVNEIAFNTLTPTNAAAVRIWREGYVGVHRANLVIENIPNIKMDQNLKERIIAEAKFLRAYYYFLLVRLYGDVPLITQPEIESSEVERTSKELIFEQVEKDLMEAIQVLPLKSQLTSEERGRATKGAAQAYLGKVYLWQKNFQDAETWFKKVIESNEYSLDPDYYHMFTTDAEFGVGKIFEINYMSNPKFRSAGNSASIFQGSGGMYGYGWTNPTQDLVDAFEEGDPRVWQTVYAAGDTMPDGKIADIGNTQTGYLNKKVYLLKREFPPSGDPKYSGKNGIKIRYGMLLLWYAEAANENGHTQQALWALNEVRERTRQGNLNVLPDVTTTDQDQLRKKIYHEERVEYGMENLRWFDLIRQGRAEKVMRAFSEKCNCPKGRNFTDGVHELFPIPQSEIDLSDGKLVQNPGY